MLVEETTKMITYEDIAAFAEMAEDGVQAGDVYVIINKAWPEWVKIGKAVDAKDRLKSYQTSDPFRAYELYHSVTKENRHTAEVEAHKALEVLSKDRKNEWFKVNLETAVSCIEGSV